jgi:PEGA domain
MVVRPTPNQPSDRARDSAARGASTGSAGPLIHVSTRCTSMDDFVEKFSGFASYGALVLPAAGGLPVGTEGRFVIRLADQTVAMRGRCRVTDVKTVPVDPAASATAPRRTLLRVALLEMEEGSRTVHARLLAHRRESPPLPVVSDLSEPTLVSPPSPVPSPPVRPPPPPPVAALARTMTMIGVAPTTNPGVIKPAASGPVNALARTMIGVAPGTGPLGGQTSAAAAPTERRVPGAAFTLPANPLGPVQVDDLASFIDSTLFETDEGMTEPTTPPPEVDIPIKERTAEPAAATAVSQGAQPAAVTAVGRAERTSRVGTHTARSTRFQVIRLAPYALCLIAGLVIGRAWRRPPTPAPTVQAPIADRSPAAPVTAAVTAAVPAPVAAVPAPVAATPAEAPAHPAIATMAVGEIPATVPAERPEPTREAEPAPVVEPTAREAVPTGDCTARIVTEPADAKIIWGGRALGQSPIDQARVPCGSATVTIEHERYQSVTREVTAEAGTPATVSQRLHRPPGTLIVTSSPPRAYVTVNDQMLGPAPRRLAAWRYEQVSIRASFPGYLPWTKKIYLKEPTTTISAQLVATGRGRDSGKRPAAGR